MKKFGIIMSFSIIIIIFIGLNYLLWERESREKDIKNLKDSSASSTLTINALSRQIENLENTLKARNDSIEKITKDNDGLRKDIEDLKQENIRSNNIIKSKMQVINDLYNNLGTEDYIKNIINQWAKYISEGSYEKAYHLSYREEKHADESIEEYTKRYKNIVKSINIKTIDLYSLNEDKKIDGEKVDNNIIGEYEKGDIFLMVELDVNLAEWAINYDILYEQGFHKYIFALKYDIEDGKWYIIDIRKPM